MPTSGLVISTAHRVDPRPVFEALNGRDGITCGAPIEGRVPIVTETASKAEDKALWDWLWTLPGVASVDVAFIDLGNDAPPAAGREPRSPRPSDPQTTR